MRRSERGLRDKALRALKDSGGPAMTYRCLHQLRGVDVVSVSGESVTVRDPERPEQLLVLSGAAARALHRWMVSQRLFESSARIFGISLRQIKRRCRRCRDTSKRSSASS